MSGLVEILDVATDDRESLVLAIKILLKWDRKVSHYRSGTDINSKPYLILMWHENHPMTLPLIAPMNEADAISDQIYAWLKTQDYGREPDHDGSNHKGWRVTNRGPKVNEDTYFNTDSTPYDVLCVHPHWIEYHK